MTQAITEEPRPRNKPAAAVALKAAWKGWVRKRRRHKTLSAINTPKISKPMSSCIKLPSYFTAFTSRARPSNRMDRDRVIYSERAEEEVNARTTKALRPEGRNALCCARAC